MRNNDLLILALKNIVDKLSPSEQTSVAEEIECLKKFLATSAPSTKSHWSKPRVRRRTLKSMREAGKARRMKLLVIYEQTGEEARLEYAQLAELCGLSKQSIMNYVSRGGGKVTLATAKSDIITIYRTNT